MGDQRFAALNLVFWVGYAWLAAKLFKPHGWAGLAGFAAVLLTCGIIESMHGSLTDFPCFVLMTAAMVVGGTGGAAVLAVATLGRETCVLGFLGVAEFRPPWREAWRTTFLCGLVMPAHRVFVVGEPLFGDAPCPAHHACFQSPAGDATRPGLASVVSAG